MLKPSSVFYVFMFFLVDIYWLTYPGAPGIICMCVTLTHTGILLVQDVCDSVWFDICGLTFPHCHNIHSSIHHQMWYHHKYYTILYLCLVFIESHWNIHCYLEDFNNSVWSDLHWGIPWYSIHLRTFSETFLSGETLHNPEISGFHAIEDRGSFGGGVACYIGSTQWLKEIYTMHVL